LVDVGTRLLRQRSLEEARKAFELASEIAPVAAADRSYDDALVNLGLLKELQGEPAEAKTIYLRYLESNPTSGVARNNLAALEYDQGRGRMDSVIALEKAVVLSNQGVTRDNLVALGKR
jgi:tetratricopeptide (TPR) repeat protein